MSSYAHKERWDENKSEWSDLMVAVYKGKNEKVKKLITEGAAINFESNTTFKLNAIEVAIRKDNEVAFKLLTATDSISNLKDYIRLASAQESALIMKQIIENGGNVNDTLVNGHSVLMYSASFGSYEVFETLLKNGANVNQTRKVDNWNALLLAAFNGEIKKVQLLLEYGADKTHKDKNGRTAYDLVDSIYDRYNVPTKDKEELKRILK
jgi:ankyrin repeat protein